MTLHASPPHSLAVLTRTGGAVLRHINVDLAGIGVSLVTGAGRGVVRPREIVYACLEMIHADYTGPCQGE